MKQFIFLLFFCNMLHAQWSPVKTFNSSSPIHIITDFNFVSEQRGFLISYQNNTNTFYRTIDGGVNWDSTTTVFGDFRSIIMVTDSTIYAAGNLLMNQGTPNAYQSKQIYRSLDAGQTWSQHEVFNTTGFLDRNCMVFTNDSTGFISCMDGLYYTNDYGTNWSLLNAISGQFPVVLGSEVASFYNNNVYLTEVNSLAAQTNFIDCYGTGGVGFTSSYGDTLIRTNICNDGWGNIWRALTISELGGSTNVLHFLDIGISDVAINPNGIFVCSQGPIRSIDNGQSFFKQDFTLQSDTLLVFNRIEFIDNNIAYALAVNLDSGIMKLLKTTNAGGITTNYITQPLQNVGLTNEVDEPSLQVFPNPAINELKIESSSWIDQIEIFDLTGRCLAKYPEIQSKQFKVDCHFLHSGNYLLMIRSGDKSELKQIIIN